MWIFRLLQFSLRYISSSNFKRMAEKPVHNVPILFTNGERVGI